MHLDTSFWLSRYGPYTPSPPLEGPLDVDVAVVGGGFTGLSTAFNLRRLDSGLRVAVLEGEIVGYGASGRNGGFSMTLFGLEPAITKLRYGLERTVEAHRYMERAVDYVDTLVRAHGLDSDYSFPGFLRVATTPAFARRIRHDMKLLSDMGIEGIEWWDAARLQKEVASPLFQGAWWEPRGGLLNPAKHVRELKRIAGEAGATIHEQTPVTAIERGARFRLTTPRGTITAGRIVLATNAYSHLIPELRRLQIPAFTHMVITEPLTTAQLEPIGWRNRQGIEDARNLVHYLRLTVDDRLAIGGSDVSIAYGAAMDRDHNRRIFRDLERDVADMFPTLRGVSFAFHWGGPVSVTLEMVPVIGYLGDRRAVYSLGCMGHGVSLAQLNGQTIADLILERDTDLTDVWFVGRKVIPWPPEPLRFALSHAIRGYLRAEDRVKERPLRAGLGR